MSALLVAAGAALGAPLRFWVASWLDDDLPRGTLLVNVVGSFVLGLLVGLGTDGGAFALLGTGFCGAFTTCSAVAVQTVGLGRRGVGYAGVTVAGSVAAAVLGFGVAQA